jgi:predicted AlkP superfamily pyrophosphatase or phosphodiesterase
MIDNAARGVFWLKDRKDIRADTLWDAAKRAGKTVAIVTWPSTYGADAAWLIPEDLAPRTNPQEDIRKGSSPGLFDALSAAAGTPSLVHFGHADSGTPLDRMTGTFAAEIVKRHRPSLLLAHFLDYDHRMHAAPFTADDACKALARIDGWIAHILEAYERAGLRDQTTIFVVSDHGFLKVEQAINLGALLREAGWKDVLGEARLEDAFDIRIAGGSVALYPLEPKADAWLERVRAHLRPRLEKTHGTRLRWLTDEQARAFGGFQDAAIVLCARPGFSFRLLPPAEVAVLVEPGRFLGAHGYCPDERAMDAVFIASGAGVKPAGDIGRLHMRDVGATIAAVVGVELRDATGTDQSARFLAPP